MVDATEANLVVDDRYESLTLVNLAGMSGQIPCHVGHF
jgi:hypothetical protein